MWGTKAIVTTVNGPSKKFPGSGWAKNGISQPSKEKKTGTKKGKYSKGYKSMQKGKGCGVSVKGAMAVVTAFVVALVVLAEFNVLHEVSKMMFAVVVAIFVVAVMLAALVA